MVQDQQAPTPDAASYTVLSTKERRDKRCRSTPAATQYLEESEPRYMYSVAMEKKKWLNEWMLLSEFVTLSFATAQGTSIRHSRGLGAHASIDIAALPVRQASLKALC